MEGRAAIREIRTDCLLKRWPTNGCLAVCKKHLWFSVKKKALMWLTVDDTEAGQPDSYSRQADGSHEAGTASSGQTLPKDSCTAFVSNLDYAVTADQLREIFSKVC